jgi:hypothetical protein
LAYAVRDDVFLLALSAQAFVVLPRPVADDAIDAASATIRLEAHGLATTDVITFRVTDGGTLPTGISAFTPYYPIPVTSDLFRVATSPNGTPIASWVSGGTGWSIVVDSGRRIDAHLEETAAEIDEHLTAHDPPILVDPITHKFPQVLIGMNARMAARAAVLSLELENDAYRVAKDRLIEREEVDKVILADWKGGKPIQPRPTDENGTIPDNAARASAACPMPWRNDGVL